VARDPTTTVIVLVAVALGAATLIPWGARWQLYGVLLSVSVALWTVSTLVQWPRLFWVENVGSVLPTLAATVLVAQVVARERRLVAHTEVERNTREARLREANRRLQQEIEKHRRTEEALRFALRELDHRVKNTLAIVQSVAQHTLDASSSREEFREAFSGRIQAMARIHGALAARRWEGMALRELIELVVGPYRHHTDSVSIECDGGSIPAGLARVLGMALHELATNAAKHGALSTDGGHVVVSSHIGANDVARLHLEWKESNGPAVVEPSQRGLGSKLIEEALASETGASVDLRFEPSGVSCAFDVPLPASEGADA
jgi:two-component sensor histidine kinase